MSLRNALAVVCALLLVWSAVLSYRGACIHPLAWWSAVLLVALVVERRRYGAKMAARQPDEVPTGERFIDPETGVAMEVWYSSRTGERRYVPVGE